MRPSAGGAGVDGAENVLAKQSVKQFFQKLRTSSYRDHFGHGGSQFDRPRTTDEGIVDSTEVDTFEWNFSDPRTPHCGRVDLLSTYNAFCSDRGSLIALPPPPKRNKRNRSQVPLGSLDEASVIKAPAISLPFDTRGFPSGRGGLSDEEILSRSQLLYVDPHPAKQQSNTWSRRPWPQGKSQSKSSYTTYPHSRSVELRFFGGRSHWHVGEREWYSSKSDVAFQQGCHKWPRPLGAGQNLPLRRCGTAPARSIESVFGRGPVAKVGQPWKSLDGSIQELSPVS